MSLNKYDLNFIEKDLRHGIHELASCPDCSRRREIANKVAEELAIIKKKEA
jgi:hypothetical protein